MNLPVDKSPLWEPHPQSECSLPKDLAVLWSPNIPGCEVGRCWSFAFLTPPIPWNCEVADSGTVGSVL